MITMVWIAVVGSGMDTPHALGEVRVVSIEFAGMPGQGFRTALDGLLLFAFHTCWILNAKKS